MLFTILSSLNYTLYYFMLCGNPQALFKNIEVRIFGVIIAAATLLIALSLWGSGTYTSLWQAIKDGLCQVVSFISTSGYYVCDYTEWPTFAIVVLFSLLFIGGCCMSTSGFAQGDPYHRAGQAGEARHLSSRFTRMRSKRSSSTARRSPRIRFPRSPRISCCFSVSFSPSCLVLSWNNFDLGTT